MSTVWVLLDCEGVLLGIYYDWRAANNQARSFTEEWYRAGFTIEEVEVHC